ncbi:MAG: helix-turn-helix transcriptional regulator [Alphaproteobacteria bacterium]|nr:helix-turn-helix transcriptional regulator [Alphaproteobacteria bacterium]
MPDTMAAACMAPDVMSANCPSRHVLKHVTSRWGVLVLIALRGETLRYSALRRRIDGVSERMLALTLQNLEADGFVLRRALDAVPPHVEYSLTETGDAVSSKVADLACWIEDNLHLIPSVQGSDRGIGASD